VLFTSAPHLYFFSKSYQWDVSGVFGIPDARDAGCGKWRVDLPCVDISCVIFNFPFGQSRPIGVKYR
jgi:hypothetical protein